MAITRLDRLSRFLVHLGADLKVTMHGIDTPTPTRACAHVWMLAGMAELQHDLIVANTNEGFAAALARASMRQNDVACRHLLHHVSSLHEHSYPATELNSSGEPVVG